MSTSRLEIDLGALDRNVALVRSVLDAAGAPASGRVRLCGVIKQDGYAMGAARLAKRLESAGVDLLAVFCLDEARALADLPIETPILILMPVHALDRADPLYRLASRSRLHLVVHNRRQAADLAALASRLGATLHCHVQVDTGMSRGGCPGDEAEEIVAAVQAAKGLRLAGVMTHFSSPATDAAFTDEQARRFRLWIERIKPLLAAAADKPGPASAAAGAAPCLVHAANTAGLFRSASLHGTMVRIGQGLLGYGAEELGSGVQFGAQARRLEPAVRWVSRIAHVEHIPAGWPVGYNRTWTAKRPSRIALVPVGYANGLPLTLSNHGALGLTGRPWQRVPVSDGSRQAAGGAPIYAPIVGRISMDQVTLDVTDLPESFAGVGAEVEIISSDPAAQNHLPTLAARAGTITHDILSRIAPSVERCYLASPSPSGRTALATGHPSSLSPAPAVEAGAQRHPYVIDPAASAAAAAALQRSASQPA